MTNSWRQGDVITRGTKIHYWRTGGNKPQVVLAHGFTDNALCWSRLARQLESDFDLIMYDARGHGLSDAPRFGYSIAEQAADMVRLIRALDLKEPAVIGHSMGASAAAAASASFPFLISRIVLEDPPWHGVGLAPSFEQLVVKGVDWRDQNMFQKSQSVEDIIADGRLEYPNWDEAEWLPWAQSKQQISLNAFNEFASPEIPWYDVIVRVLCPLLLITADTEMGALVSPEVAAEAADLWNKGQHVHIPFAGHSIRREQFDAYLKAVVSFIK